MAKRKGKRGKAVHRPEVAFESEPMAPSSFSGYDGANFTQRRAQIWWPTLDTRRELDGFSRAELVRRVRWLYANVGLAKRLIKGLAEMVGYLTPQAITNDAEWNDLAEANFRNRAGAKQVFDRAGKVNFFGAQVMLTRSAFRDGDVVTVMTETKSHAAQWAFYEGHQLESPEHAKKGWIDGVKISRDGRHLAYGISRGDEKPFVVSARNSIYFGEFDAIGHPRAVPPLAHAVNHVMDITEIWSDVKGAIKVNSLSGIVRTQKDVASEHKGKQGLVGAVRKRTDSNGDQMTVEEVYAGRQITRLAPGEDVKILSDPRPEQSQRDQISDLIRDVSWGTGLPPEVIWQMSGLTGPGVRFVLELASRWISARQRELEAWCRVVWVRHIAKEIDAGRLPMPSDPEWWKVEFVPQASMTIDRGRDGKQRLAEIEVGAGTLADWHKEASGADWQDKVKQRVTEVKFARERCADAGLDFHDVFPPRPGAAVPDSKSTSKDDDD